MTPSQDQAAGEVARWLATAFGAHLPASAIEQLAQAEAVPDLGGLDPLPLEWSVVSIEPLEQLPESPAGGGASIPPSSPSPPAGGLLADQRRLFPPGRIKLPGWTVGPTLRLDLGYGRPVPYAVEELPGGPDEPLEADVESIAREAFDGWLSGRIGAYWTSRHPGDRPLLPCVLCRANPARGTCPECDRARAFLEAVELAKAPQELAQGDDLEEPEPLPGWDRVHPAGELAYLRGELLVSLDEGDRWAVYSVETDEAEWYDPERFDLDGPRFTDPRAAMEWADRELFEEGEA